MAEDNNSSQQKQQSVPKRGTFIERLVQKTLSSFGGIFERPFQSDDETARLPSTSDLTERLKKLIDAGVREQEDGSRIAPHLIRLKHAWGQTTEEFEENLERLKTELLVVAIDHINDNRYRTIAPIKLEIKPDILSEGLTLAVGFDASNVAEAEKVEIPAEIFAGLLPQENTPKPPPQQEIETAVFVDLPSGEKRELKLLFIPDGKTNLTVGRSKEQDLFLDDQSVSKLHASLVMNSEGKLRVADVGSTNGTYIDKERISYGKAYEIEPEKTVGFGEVKCRFEWDFSRFENESVQNQPIENDFRQIADDSGESETVFSGKPETVTGDSLEETETVKKSSGEPETVLSNPKKDLE
ncbi:MAG: FHA domain-containing protein [Acidobacteriota bacterium]|nr:FHA domain-containing protein [Acidobacteriota bacterium]